MKYSFAASSLLALHIQNTAAFAPAPFVKSSTSFTRRAAIIDPSILADAHHHVNTLSDVFSTFNLADAADAVADAATDAATDVAAAAATTVTDVAATAATTATDVVTVTGDVAKQDNGFFGFLEGPIEFLLGVIHSALVGVGMNEDAWGVTIIAMTSIIKLLTYPLTAQQLQSTNKMQALQPTIKELQAKYQSNPEVMNQKIAEVYQTNEVNPLAGCVPSLLQIPIFIGLYRAVLTLAKDDKLNEPFLWLPNLEGPTYGADPAHGSDWILKWVDGAPALGWDDSLAFLTIPVILVLSQTLSMNLMATKDQEQPAFIKFLPLLIGWFSLNVPAALGIYWVANNFITTALTLQIRSSFDPVVAVTPSAGGGAVRDVAPTQFTPAPISEKPAGFGATEFSGDEVTPITPVDAEIISDDTPAATSKPNRGKGKKKKKKGKR